MSQNILNPDDSKDVKIAVLEYQIIHLIKEIKRLEKRIDKLKK